KLHGAVFGVVSRHQFGFSFWQVERNAVRLRIRRHQINKKSNELSVDDVPPRNESPEMSALRLDNRPQTETPGLDQHSHQRKSQRNFVADHLRAGAQPAEQ